MTLGSAVFIDWTRNAAETFWICWKITRIRWIPGLWSKELALKEAEYTSNSPIAIGCIRPIQFNYIFNYSVGRKSQILFTQN